MFVLAFFLGLMMTVTAAAQGRGNKSWHRNDHSWRAKGPKATHGYRNYGQFRRTQVGNRRYRLAKRYRFIDGVRTLRWIRVYY